MRTLLIALALAVLVTGCGRKKTESQVAANQKAEAVDTTAEQGLVSLGSDPNPYISNIAKHVLSSWNAKDYSSAVSGMSSLKTLCRSDSQRKAVLSSLDQLKVEVNQAAAQGDANAKQAVALLTQYGL